MSATIAAALKKIAVALLTNPKALKTILGIVLGILLIIIMPIAAVLGIFSGAVEIDTSRFQQMLEENLTAEEQAGLQEVEDTMAAIEEAMEAAGFPGRTKEAQVLYVLTPSETAHEPDFVSRLVGCFTTEQTDKQLVDAVNAAFGTGLSAGDFRKAMSYL